MTKIILILVILSVVAMTTSTVRMYKGVPMYPMEPLCAKTGGMCVKESDCIYLTEESGLCPKNQHKGVECCYAVENKPAPCEQHLGECMSWCNEGLRAPGTDCPPGTYCCILV